MRAELSEVFSKHFILEKMPVTLASRAEIVKKMDQQFNDDLKMRQDTTTVGKEMLKIRKSNAQKH